MMVGYNNFTNQAWLKKRKIVIEKIRHFKGLVRSKIDPSDLDAFHRVASQVNDIIEKSNVFKI